MAEEHSLVPEQAAQDTAGAAPASPAPSTEAHSAAAAPTEPTGVPGLVGLTHDWLAAIGEDPEREGLQRTPQRVAKAWAYMTEGYGQTLTQVVGEGVFAAEGSEMVIVKDIEFYSMCEHHMLPFYGRAHVAYIPDGKILGLSKFARIVDLYSRRLQVQERITTQVADSVEELLAPKGVAVLMEGIHLCMAMRGVQKQNSSTTTSAMRGLFRTDPRTRAEFMSAVQGTLRSR